MDSNVPITNLRFKNSNGNGCCWDFINKLFCYNLTKSYIHAKPFTSKSVIWWLHYAVPFIALTVLIAKATVGDIYSEYAITEAAFLSKTQENIADKIPELL